MQVYISEQVHIPESEAFLRGKTNSPRPLCTRLPSSLERAARPAEACGFLPSLNSPTGGTGLGQRLLSQPHLFSVGFQSLLLHHPKGSLSTSSARQDCLAPKAFCNLGLPSKAAGALLGSGTAACVPLPLPALSLCTALGRSAWPTPLLVWVSPGPLTLWEPPGWFQCLGLCLLSLKPVASLVGGGDIA